MLKPNKLANKNFLSSLDTSVEEFFHILEIAKNFKNKDLNIESKKDKVFGLIFDKSSTLVQGLVFKSRCQGLVEVPLTLIQQHHK